MSMINTVLGPIAPEELGITLYHEHLAMKPGPEKEFQAYTFNNPDLIIEELTAFKEAGGGAFVEMTPLNFGRDIRTYQDISKCTAVHVICCTGFHKKRFLPDWVISRSSTEIEADLIKEITVGIDETGVCAGVIKVGTSQDKIYPVEEKTIEIVSSVHKKTNVPISTHCDKGLLALEQGGLLLKHGVHPDRIVFGHVDIPNNVAYLEEICRHGFNVGIDHIGRNLSHQESVKLGMIRTLIDKGFINNIFIAGDMGKKDYLNVYGGKPGFSYIPASFKESFIKNGMDEEQYNHILVENPKRFFQTNV